MLENKYKISVIVPVYKAEKFVQRCVYSLLNQDLDRVEFIFINDGTPDKSFQIIRQITSQSHRNGDVVLLENKKNIGIAQTRRKGMLEATGKYVIQIDSDDWVEPTMLSSLYAKIEEEGSDVVVCDYYISYKTTERYMREEYKKDIEYNIKNMMLGNLHPSFCTTLIRRAFYMENDLIPTGEINMGEDIETMLRLFSLTSKVSYLPKAFLHYTQYNTLSLTKTMGESSINDAIVFISKLEDFVRKSEINYEQEFCSMIVFYKKVFTLNKRYTKYFYTIYPEANKFKYIFMYKSYGLPQKIAMSFMLIKMPFVTRAIYKTHMWIRKKIRS
ncbi:Glycosyltransferase, group 2 family protein [Capnocytophaga canis]|uniref:Glycosyltransferase, group 2 family protein n=1 Tax=Capnocytophaga canis TaxID=1848903 RepID=A0A0B7HYA0_9FLAO|nr:MULTISPECIES: glycosyltransferase family 2 protein [Capnocytophaga]ATA72523.1 glycosyltransferase family 2 protein [Capnocytophaga sp. H4358]CEN43426.1 Glycosyltransferase, group 2 family protein [Capnocytophaga canis]CEN44390.1 Glycosyltransferase, group 2 family protein [Capnocytophaga canis]